MDGISLNPYALYVFCDGAMNYDSRSTGGVGIEIRFPESLNLESIKISRGRYEGANIERLELEAILQGMNEVIKLFEEKREELRNINTIIFITDRIGLVDITSPYRIRDWRRNRWHNYEGKAIKNSDLLDKIDKTRRKITDKISCRLRIQYRRRKFTKSADKSAKMGKKQTIAKRDIALKGLKIGKRKYDDIHVDYKLLGEKDEYVVRVFKKVPVQEQWEISVEICEGKLLGKKLNIYTDSEIERRLHRHHQYRIRIKEVFANHVIVYRTIKEIRK